MVLADSGGAATAIYDTLRAASKTSKRSSKQRRASSARSSSSMTLTVEPPVQKSCVANVNPFEVAWKRSAHGQGRRPAVHPAAAYAFTTPSSSVADKSQIQFFF